VNATRSRILLATCVLALLGLGVAWVAWPRSPERADLVAGPASTTSTTTTTAPPSSPTTAPPTTAPPAPVVAGPERLRIESLGLDARVVPVGLEPDGLMEIPPATEVGWYRLGPNPGSSGSAVLAAHVDYAGERGAFFDLASIQVGDEVLVDGGGTTAAFVVAQREQIAKAEVDLARYFTDQGPSRLTLITCGGAFDQGVGHYEDNIIITAVPAPTA
jgi:LPXTG-site transpeptidase (sortase) family protein